MILSLTAPLPALSKIMFICLGAILWSHNTWQKRLLAISAGVHDDLRKTYGGKDPQRHLFGCSPHSVLKSKQPHLTAVNSMIIIFGAIETLLTLPRIGHSLQGTSPGLGETHITERGQGRAATGQGPSTTSTHPDRGALSLDRLKSKCAKGPRCSDVSQA